MGGSGTSNVPSRRVAERGQGERERYVVRGGSWNNEARNVRVANRNRNEPGNRNDNIGFRCAQ
ncbi:MAG: SUMF1/EgtB/PvdO family nonheme iron enzyme [Candidatus Binatia bacterium]